MSKAYTVRCQEINHNLNGVFTFNNSQFEIPRVLEKEKIDVNLLYGKDKGKASLVNIIEPSPYRIEPVCPVYDICGGCKLLHTTYENELRIKTDVVKKLLGNYCEVKDCLGMEGEPFHYRNKIHATLSKDKKGRIISGLYEETTHNVVPVSACAIENKNASLVMKTIRDYMEKYGILPYNEDTGKGIIRHILFRTTKTGDTLVVIVSGAKIFPDKNKMANAITEAHPFVKSVLVNYNTKKTSMILGQKEEILIGPGYVTDEMCGLKFRISAHSFYQINTTQAEKIYTDAIKTAKLTKDDTILDAYCGIGTIAAVCAKITGAHSVTGVELNPAAVKDARENAKLNDLRNLQFIEDDAGDFLISACGAEMHYSCVIMDPPRSGASDSFIKALGRMKPEKIIYISCNPITLKRDLSHIIPRGYKVDYIRPYDMFPHTGHIETAVILTKIATQKSDK